MRDLALRDVPLMRYRFATSAHVARRQGARRASARTPLGLRLLGAPPPSGGPELRFDMSRTHECAAAMNKHARCPRRDGGQSACTRLSPPYGGVRTHCDKSAQRQACAARRESRAIPRLGRTEPEILVLPSKRANPPLFDANPAKSLSSVAATPYPFGFIRHTLAKGCESFAAVQYCICEMTGASLCRGRPGSRRKVASA
jgi:hypothetical protein